MKRILIVTAVLWAITIQLRLERLENELNETIHQLARLTGITEKVIDIIK